MDLTWLNPLNCHEAFKIQKMMAAKVVIEDCFNLPKRICGLDVSNNPYDSDSMVYASAVILSYPELEVIEEVSASAQQTFPYIPGLLGFREAPVLLQAIDKLHNSVDLYFIDGHGISHPRGLGIASHIGVLLDRPTIGVAKSILVGHAEESLGDVPGSLTALKWKEKEIGMLLRSKKRSNPLIISSGHKVSLSSAVNLVVHCLNGYRLPEPTRQAHLAANRARVKHKNSLL
jgi:deoxyribonuclease V